MPKSHTFVYSHVHFFHMIQLLSNVRFTHDSFNFTGDFSHIYFYICRAPKVPKGDFFYHVRTSYYLVLLSFVHKIITWAYNKKISPFGTSKAPYTCDCSYDIWLYLSHVIHMVSRVQHIDMHFHVWLCKSDLPIYIYIYIETSHRQKNISYLSDHEYILSLGHDNGPEKEQVESDDYTREKASSTHWTCFRCFHDVYRPKSHVV